MDIKLYRSFYKKENSTLAPASNLSDTITASGTLKEPTSILNPVVKFKRENFSVVSSNNPAIFNYAYIPTFQRYYFIKDWVWDDGVWQAIMRVDVLASYQEAIGGLQAYLERTSSPSYIDGAVIDKLYPATTNFDIEKTLFHACWHEQGLSYADCFYVIGVVGNYPGSTGAGVTYYAMSPAQMINFINYLMSSDVYDNMGFGLTGEPLTVITAKALYNPIQYITSCFYFPVNRTKLGTLSTVNIHIGPYNIGTGAGEIHPFTGYYLGKQADFYDYQVIDLPSGHPQLADRGKFVQYAPYTRYTLHYAPFGSIPIDPSFFEIGDQLSMTTWMDGATGKGRLILDVKHPTGALSYEMYRISEHSSLVGVPIQLSQVTIDYLNSSIATIDSGIGVANALGGLASGNLGSVGAGISQAVHGIGDSLQYQSPQLLTAGTNGSIIGLHGETSLQARYTVIADDNPSELGKPSCKTAYISVAGNYGDGGHFIKCAEVHIDFKCLDDERPLILQHLLNGFFYEV